MKVCYTKQSFHSAFTSARRSRLDGNKTISSARIAPEGTLQIALLAVARLFTVEVAVYRVAVGVIVELIFIEIGRLTHIKLRPRLSVHIWPILTVVGGHSLAWPPVLDVGLDPIQSCSFCPSVCLESTPLEVVRAIRIDVDVLV